MALPELRVQARRVLGLCKCGESVTLTIPVMPRLKASYMGEDDIMSVTDAQGVAWVLVETDEGFMRHPLEGGTCSSWSES